MGLSMYEAVSLQHWSHQLIVKSEHFKQQLRILNMMVLVFRVTILQGNSVGLQLGVFDVAEQQIVIWTLVLIILLISCSTGEEVRAIARPSTLPIAYSLIELGLGCSLRLGHWSGWSLLFQLLDLVKYFMQLLLPFLLFLEQFIYWDDSFPIDKVWSASLAWEISVDASPGPLVQILNVPQSIQSRYFVLLLLKGLSRLRTWYSIFTCLYLSLIWCARKAGSICWNLDLLCALSPIPLRSH